MAGCSLANFGNDPEMLWWKTLWIFSQSAFCYCTKSKSTAFFLDRALPRWSMRPPPLCCLVGHLWLRTIAGDQVRLKKGVIIVIPIAHLFCWLFCDQPEVLSSGVRGLQIDGAADVAVI
jgi:hypothetical protein